MSDSHYANKSTTFSILIKWIPVLLALLLTVSCTAQGIAVMDPPAQDVETTPSAIAPAAAVVTSTSTLEPPDATATQPPATAEPTSTVEASAVPPAEFDGERAYADVEHQVSLGPRLPGSDAHAQAVDWMTSELERYGWTVEIQEATMLDQPVRNVIAKRGSGRPWSIIGAHYDSRMKADNDPDPANHDMPVPAANDGASGVAVLLELARTLPEDIQGEVWLAFFDSEDQGNLPGWDWILGSRVVADSLEAQPDSVIVVDMIGDADLNIYQERNSDPGLTAEIWSIAADLGYAQFIHQPKFAMLDDHTPFLEKGIRAIDIIDFDYPYWHTISDTPDKVSAESLEAVGSTVLHWLRLQHQP